MKSQGLTNQQKIDKSGKWEVKSEDYKVNYFDALKGLYSSVQDKAVKDSTFNMPKS